MGERIQIPVVVRLYVVAAVLCAAAALTWAVTVDLTLPARDGFSLGALAAFLILGFVLELAEHGLTVGEGHGSIAFIIYMAAIVSLGPVWGLFITTASVSASSLSVGKSPIKTVFNISQHVLALGVGSVVYLGLGGEIYPSSLDSTVVPYAGIVLSYFAINSAAVSGVIALNERRRFVDVWLTNTWGLVGYDLVASGLGLATVWLYFRFDVGGFLGVIVPILFLRHTYLVNARLQATNRELLDLMVKEIEARDPYTSGHSKRVSRIARSVARSMGLGFREVDNIATAALLHDVGKVYEEFAPILSKEGKLTPEERALMESHPSRSAELIHTISTLRGYIEDVVRHHHERFDGSGYPDRQAGEDIPLGSRIVMVADTADAMTTDRPYRKALPLETVTEELRKYAGEQFDPAVVSAFERSPEVKSIIAARILSQEPGPEADARRSEPPSVRSSRRAVRQAQKA